MRKMNKCRSPHQSLTARSLSDVTVSLRECTCSHFLLFVWGGLALVGSTAKPEHHSTDKTRREKIHHKHSGEIVRLPPQTATPAARSPVSSDGHEIYRYGLNCSDGWSRSAEGRRAADVSWVVMMAGEREREGEKLLALFLYSLNRGIHTVCSGVFFLTR